MLQIFLCEDDEYQLKNLSTTLEKCILIEDYDMSVSGTFQTPNGLINYISSTPPIHGIYFLDIDLKSKIDGFKLATIIRTYDPRAFIIFVTVHEQMTPLTFHYKTEALDYIIKDSENYIERLCSCLSNVLDKHKKMNKYDSDKICFSTNSKHYFISEADIFYIDTSSVHKYTVHYTKGTLEIRGQLNELIPKLSENFYQCHRSCIVNLTHIEDIDKKNCCIHLDNTTSCHVSKRHMSRLLELLQRRK